MQHSEDLLVDRKQDLPKPPRFGAAAGSLANTLWTAPRSVDTL